MTRKQLGSKSLIPLGGDNYASDHSVNKKIIMDILLEQESNMNTIAVLALSNAIVKPENTINNNHHVQIQTENMATTPTDAVKSSMDAVALECEQPTVKAAFHNLPPCDPIEISFRDVSYSVQKMFSKRE